MPPTNDMSAPLNNSWGIAVPEGSVRRIKLPSGSECDAERTGMEGLVRAGVLSEGDSLTDLVDKKHIRRVKGGKGPDRDEIKAESVIGDREALSKIVMATDRAIPHIVKNPVVRLHFEDIEPEHKGDPTTRRIPEDKREPGVIYTDQIPIEDKMFLFNWSVAGGSPDAARFREQSSSALAGVANVEGVQRKAKSGRRRKG